MGNPSLTLVARTPSSRDLEQFAYYRCGLATRSRLHHRSIARQADVLLALMRGRPKHFPARLMKTLESSNTFLFFSLLDRLRSSLRLDVFAKEILNPVRERFRALRALELAALDEEIRRGALWSMINATPEPDRKPLMALSELFPDDTERNATISRSHGGIAAEDVIRRWVASAQQQHAAT
jgi:hypothetical protein